MELELLDQSFYFAARLVERGDYDDALIVLRPLIEVAIPDFQKSMACLNTAIVYGLKNEVRDALVWYDRGIGFERSLGRFFVAEHKAAYLAEQNRVSESLAIYEGLLWETSLTDEDKERIRHNISALKERLGS